MHRRNIPQRSTGYRYNRTFDQAILDAIRVFVEHLQFAPKAELGNFVGTKTNPFTTIFNSLSFQWRGENFNRFGRLLEAPHDMHSRLSNCFDIVLSAHIDNSTEVLVSVYARGPVRPLHRSDVHAGTFLCCSDIVFRFHRGPAVTSCGVDELPTPSVVFFLLVIVLAYKK